MEIEVKIKYEGKDETVVIKEITWEEKTACIRKSLKEVHKGRQLVKEYDNILQKEMMLLASILKAPFEKNLESIRQLAAKDGEKLFRAYTELNEYDEDDAEGEA
jgi:hypothetical protein